MREGLEPLQYSTLAPAVYHVYLHGKDFERLRGVFPRIVEEAERALDEELRRLNTPTGLGRLVEKLPWLRKPAPKVECAQGGWQLYFHEDVDEELQPGEILIHSELALPPKPELGAGMMTKRVATRSGDQKVASQSFEPGTAPQPVEPVYAQIHYEDDRGPQTCLVKKNSIVIGRGGATHWVDLRLYTKPDVSREHVRIRREPATGEFFIKDVSQFGATVNGEPVPSSIETTGDEKHDRNIEVPLPDHSRIVLAEVLTLDFEVVTPP